MSGSAYGPSGRQPAPPLPVVGAEVRGVGIEQVDGSATCYLPRWARSPGPIQNPVPGTLPVLAHEVGQGRLVEPLRELVEDDQVGEHALALALTVEFPEQPHHLIKVIPNLIEYG